MTCMRCSRDIEHDSIFCRFCGASVRPAPVSDWTRTRLFRSEVDRKIGGVCGGLAEYFRVDPTIVRLLVVILTIYPGAILFGVLAYAIAWAVIPLPPAPPLQTITSTA